jgi:hypothetical protein
MHSMDPRIWEQESWIVRTQEILNSFRRWLGKDLLELRGTPAEDAKRLFQAPFVVVAHNTLPDPVFNYGNQQALQLWELPLENLLGMPSRLTAEPMHRDERARLLERTTRDGYVDDYAGVRISRTGRRFQIEQAIVWNLVDAAGNPAGQAATFSRWTPLPEKADSPEAATPADGLP